MIRTVIALFVGAVALCGYIIMKQTPDRQAGVPLPMATSQSDVTRAATPPLLSESLSAPTEAVEWTPPATIVPDPIVVAAPAEPIAPQIAIDETDLVNTTANVLAGLGLHVDVRNMAQEGDAGTANVLAGLGVIDGEAMPKPAPRSELEFMVIELLQLGLPDTEIDARIIAMRNNVQCIQIAVVGQNFADLTDAMDIKPPSFYAAYGSKAALFERAMLRYAQENALPLDELLPPARAAAEALAALLRGAGEQCGRLHFLFRRSSGGFGGSRLRSAFGECRRVCSATKEAKGDQACVEQFHCSRIPRRLVHARDSRRRAARQPASDYAIGACWGSSPRVIRQESIPEVS